MFKTVLRNIGMWLDEQEPKDVTPEESTIEGWFSLADMRSYNKLVDKIHNGVVVEVGSYLGRSAASIIPVCKRNNIELICVDLWEQNHDYEDLNMIAPRLSQFIHNLRSVDKEYSVITVQSTSISAARKFFNETIDAVFIDAQHDYDSVKDDILAWLPLVKKGGWIGGHDFCRGFGVKKAVKEIFRKDYKKLPTTIWYHEVK
jgi:predicted O-methyltransferase YrrM